MASVVRCEAGGAPQGIQNSATALCSSVSPALSVRISSSCAAKASVPGSGGGAGRKASPLGSAKGATWPQWGGHGHLRLAGEHDRLPVGGVARVGRPVARGVGVIVLRVGAVVAARGEDRRSGLPAQARGRGVGARLVAELGHPRVEEAPVHGCERRERGVGHVADRLALVGGGRGAALALKRVAGDGAHRHGVVGGPGLVDRGVVDQEEARRGRGLGRRVVDGRKRHVEPLGDDRGGLGGAGGEGDRARDKEGLGPAEGRAAHGGLHRVGWERARPPGRAQRAAEEADQRKRNTIAQFTISPIEP